MSLRELNKLVPSAEKSIMADIVMLTHRDTVSFDEIVAYTDCSMLPPRPKADRYSGNRFEPRVVIMAILEKLVKADRVTEEWALRRGCFVYRASLEIRWSITA